MSDIQTFRHADTFRHKKMTQKTTQLQHIYAVIVADCVIPPTTHRTARPICHAPPPKFTNKNIDPHPPRKTDPRDGSIVDACAGGT